MKLPVFVSWSGPRSRVLASALVKWLPHVLQNVAPWMSYTNLQKGDRWSEVIGKKLSEHHVGVICVTPENVDASWLMFEAGAISKLVGGSKVCPVLLGIRPADLVGPLDQFQETVFEKEDMLRLVLSLNHDLGADRVENDVVTAAFERTWPGLVQDVQDIASIQMDAENVHSVLRAFAEHGMPDPLVDSSAFFADGFESHALYASACAIARKRLYVFGRKNRKLFDKDHKDFFAGLQSRESSGFGFKCLFLDPGAPQSVIEAAHSDSSFRRTLIESIETAGQRFAEAGLDPAKYARTYRTNRSLAYAVIDDAVAYTPIRYSRDGQAEALTKCGFTVITGQSPLGEQLVGEFLAAFENGSPLRARPSES